MLQLSIVQVLQPGARAGIRSRQVQLLPSLVPRRAAKLTTKPGLKV
jgi:hypothetical protein